MTQPINRPVPGRCITCNVAPREKCGCRCKACLAECGHRIDCGFHEQKEKGSYKRKTILESVDERLLEMVESRKRSELTPLQLRWIAAARKTQDTRGRLEAVHRIRMRRIAYPQGQP